MWLSHLCWLLALVKTVQHRLANMHGLRHVSNKSVHLTAAEDASAAEDHHQSAKVDGICVENTTTVQDCGFKSAISYV